MKTTLLTVVIFLALLSCQKEVAINQPEQETETGTDTSFSMEDTLVYEVVTTDDQGWFGVWNDEHGELESNGLDSITWGSPNYYASGWRYTFQPQVQPFQMLVSAAARSYSDDITINFYRNSRLVASSTNSSMKGVTRLLLNAITDTGAGITGKPLLTYEVVLSDMDSTKFDYNGWNGQWVTGEALFNTIENPLAMNFALPSGWRYSFRPENLPFAMKMQAWPYTEGGATLTVRLYVDGRMVKTATSRDKISNVQYTVQ